MHFDNYLSNAIRCDLLEENRNFCLSHYAAQGTRGRTLEKALSCNKDITGKTGTTVVLVLSLLAGHSQRGSAAPSGTATLLRLQFLLQLHLRRLPPKRLADDCTDSGGVTGGVYIWGTHSLRRAGSAITSNSTSWRRVAPLQSELGPALGFAALHPRVGSPLCRPLM